MPGTVTWTIDGDETSWPGWAEARAGAPASPLMEELIAAHPASPGAWALDVGCGTGSAFSPLTAAGYRVLGLDPTMAAIQHSRDRIVRDRLPAWAVQTTAARLPIADASVAFLFAAATLYHLGPLDLPQTLAEVRRVLQPGGQAVLHFLDADDWRRTLAPQIRPEEVPMPAHRAVITCFASDETIRHWIESTGLEIVSLELRTRASEVGEMRNWIVTCVRAR
ncbi:MAG: class I SAM-dependent methyltransferase [Anaerolineae bacterium]|nr:class I SAM-dependent methyltransferase [Anaerolineae bacterium]